MEILASHLEKCEWYSTLIPVYCAAWGIKMKKVSVIIPCYNAADEIDRMMECVVGQTFGLDNLEIILVNDGSHDDTLSHLSEWENRYEDNVIIINCEDNNGLSYARNVAMDLATGEYIAFVDADDWIVPNYIERMVELSEKYKSDITICGHDRPSVYNKSENVSAKSEKETVYDISDDDGKKKFLASHIYSTSVCWEMYRREFIEKNNLRFPVGTHYEDAFFTYMAYMFAGRVSECADVMYHYYRNPTGLIMGDCEEEKRERLISLRMFYDNCMDNGWLESFHDELEIIFIRKYYVEMLEVMFRTFEHVDYSVYLGMRDWLVQNFPNYNKNPYLVGEYSELDRIFLQLISKDFDEQKLELVRKAFLQTVYHRDKPVNTCQKRLRDLYYPQKELFFMQLDTLCDDKSQENTDIMRELLFMVPIQKSGSIKDLLRSIQTDRLESEIYRYVIDREIFLSYLRNYLKKISEVLETEKVSVYKEVAGWF